MLGEKLSRLLKPGDIVCLFGELGSGKTVLTQGIARGLGFQRTQVSSPTFTFMNIYDGKVPLYHFDLYRIEHLDELSGIGAEEFLYGNGICVVEWAEKLGVLLPQECLEIKIKHRDETSRQFNFAAKGERARALLKEFNV